MAKSLKVRELVGADLDKAVACALGYVPYSGPWWQHKDDPLRTLNIESFSPTTNGQQGQDIIEGDWIGLERPSRGQTPPVWRAVMDNAAPRIGTQVHQIVVDAWGPTALIAAMRCKVASVYGDNVPGDLFSRRRAA